MDSRRISLTNRHPPPSGAREWAGLSAQDIETKLTILGLYINTPERAVICRKCQYALQPAGDAVTRHLGEKHKLPARERRGVTAYIHSLELPDPNKLPVRFNGSEPHPHLALRAGVACAVCGFRSTSFDTVRRHLSKEHSIRGNRDGWAGHCTNSGLVLQSWSQNGTRSYWNVTPRNDGAAAPNADMSDVFPRQQLLDRIHQAERERLTSATRAMEAVTDTGTDDLAGTGAWLRRTDWVRTSKGQTVEFFAGSPYHPPPLDARLPLASGESVKL